jgi:hypothetical protein
MVISRLLRATMIAGGSAPIEAREPATPSGGPARADDGAGTTAAPRPPGKPSRERR